MTERLVSAWKEFTQASQGPPGVRRLYFLYGWAALLLSGAIAVHEASTLPWGPLLLLGALAGGASTLGLRIFENYTLSLELSIYLYALLCYGFPTALLSILIASCILIVHAMASSEEPVRLDVAFRKWTNTFVLGLSLWGAGIAMDAFVGADGFFAATWRNQMLGLCAFWLAFTFLNNLLFLPMDFARAGLRSLRQLPREAFLDGAIHAISVLSGAGFALLSQADASEVVLLLLPVLVVLVVVLNRLSVQTKNLLTQFDLVRRLNTYTADLHTTLNLPQVMEVVKRVCLELFGADTFFLALLDERSGRVQFARAVDHGRELSLGDADLDRGLTGRVIQTAEPLFIDDLLGEKQWMRITHREGSQTQRIRSVFMAPLLDNARCIGVFSVQRDAPRVYKPFHRELFLAFVQQLSAAVVGARLYKRATQDGLTRLFNKSFFEESLAACLARREPFGLLFLDCDDFKSVNDRYGHITGDRYLQVLGTNIQHQCRAGDIPCRYGGDEFAILLKGADRAVTRSVAERILEAVDRLVLFESGSQIRTSVSIGALWSSGETEGVHVEDVIRKIDACLYRAKIRRHTVEDTAL
ncbi:MAG: diguanylate cyclase [Acidobacteriota bacterium]